MQISLDLSEFKKITDNFSDQQNEKFMRNSVNDILFDLRNFALTSSMGISKEFTIRNKGLVRSHIKIKKAFGLIGYFGSISSNRFSGWKEQQYGSRTKRKYKVHTENARGSAGRRTLQTKYRRKHGARNLLRTVGDVHGTGSYRQMITANLAMLRRKKESGPVELPIQFGNMKPGIYNLLKSGKMKLMEIFETKQTKQTEWASNIVLRYLATGKYKKVLEKNIERMIRK